MFKNHLREPLAIGLLHLFSCLPLRISHWIGRFVGWCLVVMPNELKQVACRNLDLCFTDLSLAERRILLRRSMIESMKGITELGSVWLWPTEKLMTLTCKVTGAQLIETALEDNKGLILVIPHLGSWEFLGCYLGYQYGITGMAKPLRMASVNQVVNQARVRHGGKLVATNISGIRELYRILARGKMIGVLPDQEPSLGQGVFARFFGIQAKSAILIPRLLQKSQATIIYGYAERLPSGRGFHVHFVSGPKIATDTSLEDVTEVLNRGVEQCIRSIPEQYIWSYKRFRSRPPGEADIYRS